MQFALVAVTAPPAAAARARAVLCEETRRATVCSGPQIPRTGGFILLDAASKTEALDIMKNDPYVINGVAEYAVIEFEVKSFAEGFREFVK